MPKTDKTPAAHVSRKDRSVKKKAEKAKKKDKESRKHKLVTAEHLTAETPLKHATPAPAASTLMCGANSDLLPRLPMTDTPTTLRSLARRASNQNNEIASAVNGTDDDRSDDVQQTLSRARYTSSEHTRSFSKTNKDKGDTEQWVEVCDEQHRLLTPTETASSSQSADKIAPISPMLLFEASTFNEAAVTVMQEDAFIALRTLRPRPVSARKGRPSSPSLASTRPKSIAQRWIDDLRRLGAQDPKFFSSDEASLRLSAKATAGKPAYSGVPINEENNYDMNEVYRIEFEPKISCGGGDGTFRQLCVVAGQFMRLSIVRGASKSMEVYKPGQLFEAICDQTTVDLLINHYRARAICTTVMTKAMNLKKLADNARLHFAGKNETFAALAERSRLHLRAIFNVQKALGRARAASRRSLNDRIASAAIFMPQDFLNCKRRVRRELDDIMQVYAEDLGENGPHLAESRLFSSALIKKWCINFLVLLVLVGGGQRPQVYCQVQVPGREEFESMRDNSGRLGFIELRTMKEKTCRSRDLPFVLIPSSALKYVEFHVRHIRKGILQTANYDESECLSFPLLLHTETAQALLSAQVTRTFQQFLERFEPELATVTVMNLRSSYGTMMMKAYNDKQVFTDLDEGEFLDQLARQMNTSSEQLRSTYISIDRSDYERSAHSLITALETVTEGREDEDRIGIDAEDEEGNRRNDSRNTVIEQRVVTEAQRISDFLA